MFTFKFHQCLLHSSELGELLLKLSLKVIAGGKVRLVDVDDIVVLCAQLFEKLHITHHFLLLVVWF